MDRPKVKVTYDSKILGSGVFYVGHDTAEIRNIPARLCAQRAQATGKAQRFGMWKAEITRR